jgi:hypothetical protein|tara:strand:+ start:19720 stop:19968 length:249 start_codon:yes stop_codon:yes gene_type:complete
MFVTGKVYRFVCIEDAGSVAWAAEILEVKLPLLKVKMIHGGEHIIFNTSNAHFIRAAEHDEEAQRRLAEDLVASMSETDRKR